MTQAYFLGPSLTFSELRHLWCLLSSKLPLGTEIRAPPAILVTSGPSSLHILSYQKCLWVAHWSVLKKPTCLHSWWELNYGPIAEASPLPQALAALPAGATSAGSQHLQQPDQAATGIKGLEIWASFLNRQWWFWNMLPSFVAFFASLTWLLAWVRAVEAGVF